MTFTNFLTVNGMLTAQVENIANGETALLTAAPTTGADVATADSGAANSGDTAATTPTGGIWSTVLLFGVLILAMYFIMIRPQKKREKEQKMIRDALAAGDEIVTIGGIAGMVTNVQDDYIIIETGGQERDKVKVMKWAIQSITQMTEAAGSADSKSAEKPAETSSAASETANALEAEKKEKKKKNKDVE